MVENISVQHTKAIVNPAAGCYSIHKEWQSINVLRKLQSKSQFIDYMTLMKERRITKNDKPNLAWVDDTRKC